MRPSFRQFAFFASFILGACARDGAVPPSAPAALGLARVSFAALSGWRDDTHDRALAAFVKSCGALARQPVRRAMGPGGVGGKIGDWRALCESASSLLAAGGGATAARAFFENRFDPFALSDRGQVWGLITGYFEPQLRGSWKPTPRYRVPLYRRPPELVSADLGRFRGLWKGRRISGRIQGNRLVPFVHRHEIRAGALSGRGLELLWVDDAIDAFFLHVQGSGKVVMADGTTQRVGYAGRNGRIYRSIGRELIRLGELVPENVTLESITDWLRAHPDQAPGIMDRNESYVFFRLVKGDGPIGAQGVPLTPGRSLAVDRRFLPLGVPMWLETTDPLNARPLRRLVVAQDTGGAITGPVRADLFWGAGAEARARAGRMKHKGRYFILLPKHFGS